MTSKAKKIAVLMGGPSGEHAVSIGSGAQVVRALLELGHTVFPVLVSTQETWHLLKTEQLLKLQAKLDQKSDTSTQLMVEAESLVPLIGIKELGLDLVMIAMHGPYGEDGKVQALLELLQLPYIGSGVLASALSMDKIQFRRVMKAEGIPIPEYFAFTNESADEIQSIVEKTIGAPPLVVKPSDQGSSIGVSIVHQWGELAAALTAARKLSQNILIDRYIKGREVTVGVIGTNQLTALPVTEIIPDGEFFDYDAKYLSTKTKEICPAELDEEIVKQVQQIALQVYRTVGATGFGRVDFMLDEHDQPYVLEINTIPGMTEASLLPKAALAAGLSFTQLMEQLVAQAPMLS